MAWSSSARGGTVVMPHHGDFGVGCGRITMQPILSSSLSIESFEELGQIRQLQSM
jgi:hypothetical protein